MFLFEYDIIMSYMEDFSALKCTAIAELFYVTINIQAFTIWSNGKWSKQLAIFCNIYIYIFIYILKLSKRHSYKG